MENNQNEKVSITFEVEKDFIKGVMLVSGFSMKEYEEAMKGLDNVVLNEEIFKEYGKSDNYIQQIKISLSMIAIGMVFKKITAKEMQSKPSGLFAKLQALQEEQRKMKGEEES